MRKYILILLLPCSVFAQVNASWDASTSIDVEKYKLHWGIESGNYTDYHETLGTDVRLPVGLFGNYTYHFAVTAIDFAGNESDYSEEATLEIVTGIKEYNLSIEEYRVELFNILGRRVGWLDEVDLQTLASGTYIKVFRENGKVVKTERFGFVK